MKNYEDTKNKIIGNLLRTPLESKSLHQIAVDTRLSYVTVHKLIPNLVRKKLLTLKKKGKASLASIDFEHAKVEKLSSAILYEKNLFLKKYPQLALLVREIEEALAGRFYVLILFGSYAKEKSKKQSKKQSDIDLLFIVPDREDIEAYKEKINKSLKLYPIVKKDFKLVAAKNFIDMLNQKYTVGREAFQYGLVLIGTEHYYAMVKTYVRTKGY
ncbi:MAG TPA: nucleotidyltransferase domain-containing protein [Candidatus Nanoarchaeia archaeon]|nr:nucleotidyltransferase domain-containing protein [Candidatus Nanoarchaeia archaeon]